jgi:hypothetical protein
VRSALIQAKAILDHRKFWVWNPAVLGWLYVRIKRPVSKTKWTAQHLENSA